MSDVSAASGPLAPGAWKILTVAILGSFLAQLDATIINVSVSSLASELHRPLGTIQWVTSGYLLALTLILPLNGWLVDRIGAKAVYLWCFAAFTLSSALCGLAWSAPSLIGFRIVQGLAGGLLAPMAQMMVARVAGGEMARVAGYVTVPILLAPLLGPVVAGAILQYASWRWLFLVNVPVGVLAITLAFLFLPNDRHERRPRELDLLGLALLSPALVLFLYSADRIGGPTGLSLFALSLVLLAAFLWTALRKGSKALLDLQLFRSPLFSLASIAQFLSNGTTFAGQMLIPLYLIDSAGRSPGEMGWLMAPLGLGMLCTFPMIGVLTKRLGTRRLAAGSALLATLATAAFIFLAAHGLDLAVLTAALFLRGAGLGGIGIPAMAAAYSTVPRTDLPMATTTLNIIQRLGGPALTTLCATFLGWQLSAFPPGQAGPAPYMWAFALLCALHAVTLLVALGFPARPQGAG
jgi:EmrB/QacA subfamily drug resistance transporter